MWSASTVVLPTASVISTVRGDITRAVPARNSAPFDFSSDFTPPVSLETTSPFHDCMVAMSTRKLSARMPIFAPWRSLS